jgi:hypothetical protein
MASYTRKHAKNEAANPFSRENKDAIPRTPTDVVALASQRAL